MARTASDSRSALCLDDGARVGVVGGGPAGAFFSYFLLQMAHRVSLDLDVEIYEPRDFSQAGPRGCNMCGGIVSESLVQHLAAEGIVIPDTVIQRRIDSYFLHLDVGSVRIDTPLQEKRIAAVHRGGGPRGITEARRNSFDGYLLDLAVRNGARQIGERVERVVVDAGRPQIVTQRGSTAAYDLLVVAGGVNAPTLKALEIPGLAYRPPGTTKAYICEFFLGKDLITRYLGNSMHVFLLNLPRLEFAALIPKSDYVTVCLLGDDIDKPLVQSFLDSPQVRQCMPPHWQLPEDFCRCSPRINVSSAMRPFADRVVFVGDCATTRLYKDGIGAAYRTAKAAAVTAIFEGIGAADFRRHYWPACRKIRIDNALGRVVFTVTRQIQKRRYAQRGVWRMVSEEQHREAARRSMSTVLWDTFTGSAPYRDVFLRAARPSFNARLAWSVVSDRWTAVFKPRHRRTIMGHGVLGKRYRDGEVIYNQGELGDCMYVVQKGEVELIQRRGDKEFSLAVLGAGEFFGEMALFGNPVRTTMARSAGKTTVLTLEKRMLLRRMHEEPSLAFMLLQRMSSRIGDLEAALVRAGCDLTTMRLCEDGAPV